MKKNLFFSIIFILLLISSLILSNPTNTFAYVRFGGSWSSANPLYWYYDSYLSSPSKTAASQGATAWNNVGYSGVGFYYQYSGPVYVTETYNTSVEWDGATSIEPNFYMTYTAATVIFNKAKPAYNDSGALKSVATHELGHVLGLDHNNETQCIMISYTWGPGSRYGDYGLTTPQSDDINGIQFIY